MARRAELKAQHMNGNGFGLTLGMASQLASWPTPNTPSGGRTVSAIETMDATGRTADGRKHTASLEHAVKFASWATPKATDSKGDAYTPTETRRSELRKQMPLASWSTATVHDADRGGMANRARGETRHGSNLQDFALLTIGWRSPTACSPNSLRGQGQDPEKRIAGGHAINLQDEVRLTTPGPTSSGSPAATASGGQLNPDFSRWLMGYPAVWGSCGATAMQSCRRSRRRLSGPIST
jgi:hypothetical protein